jgi:4-aminobutyrate aminotransferase-like enzyme
VKAILTQLIGQDLPNLVRMDCSLLSGLVAEKLTQKAGGDLSRVFFCNSGTESIEGAIKFARCFTGRQQLIHCDHAFHGLTTGSLSLNGADFFRGAADLLPHGVLQRSPALSVSLPRRRRRHSSSNPFRQSCEVVRDGYPAERAAVVSHTIDHR